jgi:Carboxypeptidase regulatory-like domain
VSRHLSRRLPFLNLRHRFTRKESIKKVAVLRIEILFLLTYASAPRKVSGQGLFGTTRGVVTAPPGAVVTGATVKVTNLGTSTTTALKTNSAGVYNATLIHGTYKAEAEAKGFKTAEVKSVVLESDART